MIHPTYSIIMDLINETFPGGKLNILDYGCGDGFFLGVITEDRIAYYEGYDINPKSIETAKKKYAHINTINFHQIDKQKLPIFEESENIDVIVLIGVLQYMSSQEVANLLHYANKILREGGIFVASCTSAHWIYKLINLYRFLSPHRNIKRIELISQIEHSGLSVVYQKEKGIIFSPVFSGLIFLLFDLLDKIIFRKDGSLGPIGRGIRSSVNPLLKVEYLLPIDFGNTLFIKALKKS